MIGGEYEEPYEISTAVECIKRWIDDVDELSMDEETTKISESRY